MSEKTTHQTMRIVSVIAATVISLACGTNYAYSAWAPQFADKLQLSTTQANVIGTSANLGMYALGIPIGVITDKKNPRIAAILGMFCLGIGYYPIRTAYDKGAGSMSVALISFFSFLTGVGSCAAFQAGLKTATLNWPTHRGTATAFPLAAFGLSAFFYTMIAGAAFPGDTSGFLLLLSLATSLLVLCAIPFLHVVDHHPGTTYAVLPTNERSRRDSNVLHRTKSNGSSKYTGSAVLQPEPNVTGLALLYEREFWQLWILMGLLTGVGLMTINNIGHDVQALWNHYDDSADKDFVAHRQLMHVSIISIFSFLGRLSSGISSDIIVKKLHMSRYWCAAASAAIFMFGQIAALQVENPNLLWTLSALNGLGYGLLFGVLPALVVDTFGSQGFSTNWGFMTLAPVVSGNIYNLFYGAVYDSHSGIQRGGERSCDKGNVCYRAAYWVTFISSVFGILACLWGIRDEHLRKKRAQEEHDGHRDA